MIKVLNKVTHMPLTHIGQKLNQHMEQMNNDGWELMFPAVEAVGIEELFILFWRKVVDVPAV